MASAVLEHFTMSQEQQDSTTVATACTDNSAQSLAAPCSVGIDQGGQLDPAGAGAELRSEGVKETAAAAAGEYASASQPTGLFEQAPGSWQHQFIRALPAESLMALFRTSKCWVRIVLQTVPQVTLLLQEEASMPIAQPTHVRRGIITQLLSTRHQFAVKVWPAAWQPFPIGLADRVTTLTVLRGGHSLSTCWQWAALENLHTLCLEGFTCHQNSILPLCEAVEAGHLQHLRNLQAPNTYTPNWHRFLRTVSPQLEELSTPDRDLVKDVSQLTSLRQLSLNNCRLTTGMMQKLCEHPTLRHLSLTLCSMDKSHIGLSCNWETVTLHDPIMDVVSHMPLAGIHNIFVMGSISGTFTSYPQEVISSLAQHAHKITCQPVNGTQFLLRWPRADMAALFSRVQGAETLEIECKWSSKDALAVLWQALPISVTCIFFTAACNVAWASLWGDLPEHVVALTVPLCHISEADVFMLVRTAPLHIQRLCLTRSTAPACINRVPGLLARLQAVAPKHLTLSLT